MNHCERHSYKAVSLHHKMQPETRTPQYEKPCVQEGLCASQLLHRSPGQIPPGRNKAVPISCPPGAPKPSPLQMSIQSEGVRLT